MGNSAFPQINPNISLDEVVVAGERPGPGMWRVSRGGHDLWILATLEPLPKNMTWRSELAEARIAASQVILAPPEVTADVGFFRSITLLPSLLHARKNPDGQTLEQTLPHELYIRWLALRIKYLGNSTDESLRPMIAALDLYLHALDAAGLTSDDSIWDAVQKTARQHRVRIRAVTVEMHIANAKASIREFGLISRDAEIACLRKTIERLETDLQPMRQRANLWALGDIDGLKVQHYPDERLACLNAIFSVPELRDQLKQTKLQVDDAWLAAADSELARNETSFAVLPMTEMLETDGWLNRLRSRGYTIQEP